MERLSPLDALFVDAEDQDLHTSMAIASIAVFDAPAPSQEEFLAAELATLGGYYPFPLIARGTRAAG